MKRNGWVRFYRSTLDHWIWQDAIAFKTWMYLIAQANHKRAKVMVNGSLVYINRGQILTSIRKLSSEIGCSKKKMEKVLETLNLDGMITKEGCHKGTLLTIVNYSKFQGRGDTEEDTKEDTKEDNEGTQRGTQKLPKQEYKNDIRMNKEDKKAVSPHSFYEGMKFEDWDD